MSKKRRNTWLVVALVLGYIFITALPLAIDSHRNQARHDKAVSNGMLLWFE